MGLTGVHDFDRSICFQALQMLDASGSLKLRTLKSIPLEELEHAVQLGLRSGFGSAFLRIGSVKLFADGALGPQTAAMLQPYEDESGNSGLLFMDAEEILEHGQLAAKSGISLATHAIGDRANHEVIKAYIQLRDMEKRTGRLQLRHRIEHVQVLHPDHLRLLAENGIIASMQPIHTTSDMDTADQHWGTRSRYAYAFNTLLANGTRLVFGSDAPVESPNPFWGLHAAVTRQRHSGYPSRDGWYPLERLSLQQALESYTIHPAYAAGWENRLGRLAPGYLADLIVLPSDPFNTDPATLFTLQPERVMVNGEWVFGA
jgi:predicted amidohydrolase YtcJ